MSAAVVYVTVLLLTMNVFTREIMSIFCPQHDDVSIKNEKAWPDVTGTFPLKSIPQASLFWLAPFRGTQYIETLWGSFAFRIAVRLGQWVALADEEPVTAEIQLLLPVFSLPPSVLEWQSSCLPHSPLLILIAL